MWGQSKDPGTCGVRTRGDPGTCRVRTRGDPGTCGVRTETLGHVGLELRPWDMWGWN